jgi:aminoglycoside phosphotransferase (APT) family kinase protein
MEWVAAAVGSGARILRSRRLAGGITSSVHQIAVVSRGGTRTHVVLRRWTPTAWGEIEDAPRLVEREARALRNLEATDVPAPRVLAADASGASTGVPAILMTRVPGRMDLMPVDPAAWLRQTVAMAAHIHELDLDAEPYEWEPKDVPVPPWTTSPANWRAAGEVVRESAPAYEDRFAHGDYQHFNLLWRRGRLTGIVDWVGAFRGPADVDVAHCRLNLAVLYSADLAADFLAAYEAEAGRRIDPYWDLRSATSPARSDWSAFIPIQVGNRAPFDPEAMRRRVDDHLAAALRRT